MKTIIEEIIKFIFCVIIGTFLLWTGEILLSLVTIGKHRPRWNGYSDLTPAKSVFAELGVIAIGFIFWMVSIPIIVRVVEA